MHRNLRTLIAFSCLLILSTEAKEIKSDKLVGRLKSSVYSAPDGWFHLKVPVDREPGARVEDGPGSVEFADDAGSLYRIDYQEMSHRFLLLCQELGPQTFLGDFLTNNYLSGTVLPTQPNAHVTARNFFEEPAGPVLQAWMSLAEGSPKEPEAYRALVVTVRQNILFVVTVAPSAALAHNADAPEKLRKAVEHAALNFARSIEPGK